jgi:Raf kinase inhibitor-like YbhB/YbcL family protein
MVQSLFVKTARSLIFAASVVSCHSAAGPAENHGGQSTAAPSQPSTPGNEKDPSMLKITSPAFAQDGDIPKKYTCEGENISPPLAFANVPAGAKSLALIVDDPDAPDPAAPKRVWTHWVIFNLPATTKELSEAAKLPESGAEGLNDWNRTGYSGPCPPIGKHRYFHKLYALDAVLSVQRPTKSALEAAMKGHIVGKAELVGRYQKGG